MSQPPNVNTKLPPVDQATADKALYEMRAYLSAKAETRWLSAHFYRSGGSMTYDPKVPTACTNGKRDRFGTWAIQLELRQRGFVGGHERLHGVLRHMERNKMYRKLGLGPDLKPFNHKKMNKAEDYHINGLLFEMGFSYHDMPLGGLYDPRFTTDMTADEIYCELPDEDGEEGDEDGPRGEGWDEHEDPDEGDSDRPADEDEDDGEDGDSEQPPTNPRQAVQGIQDKLDEQVKDDLLKAQAMGGLPGSLARKLGALLSPKVDWDEELREDLELIAGQTEPAMDRPNRRKAYLAQKLETFFMGKSGYVLNCVVLAPDVSGSITETEYQTFMSEIRAILDDLSPRECHILHWDTVAHHTEVEEPEDLERINVGGYGGTVYTCVPDKINELGLEPDVVICLTDGYVDWPNENQVPWKHITLCTAQGQKAPFGKTIYVDTGLF